MQNVTIVGGGTAGWLTALILHWQLNGARRLPIVQITLIESPNHPIIGVGEGTLPWLPQQLKQLGIDEKQFIRRCNASFKLGVRFVNWNRTQEGRFFSFTHNFGKTNEGALEHYLAFGPPEGSDPFDVSDSMDAVSEAIRLGRAPRQNLQDSYSGMFRYAYHFDAASLAEYLKEVAIQRGIEHIIDDVENVSIDGDQLITHLNLKKLGTVPVGILIDCTGFKALFVSQFLKEPFIDWSSHLLCDRAMPIQVPVSENTPLESCTSATAASAGWIWRVPLFTRTGAGYVYSSGFRTDDEAHSEFCGHLGINPGNIQPRVIKMRVGRMRNSWIGNCVAIGLSAAFVEPLEATAIFSIQYAATQLAKNLPHGILAPALRSKFNATMSSFYDNIRDFIIMHYFTSNRDEPFWSAARDSSVLTDLLSDNLSAWQHRLPTTEDIPGPKVFQPISYAMCLAAKGYFTGRKPLGPLGQPVSLKRWRSHSVALERSRKIVRQLPSSRTFLSKIRSGSMPPGQLGRVDGLQQDVACGEVNETQEIPGRPLAS